MKRLCFAVVVVVAAVGESQAEKRRWPSWATSKPVDPRTRLDCPAAVVDTHWHWTNCKWDIALRRASVQYLVWSFDLVLWG